MLSEMSQKQNPSRARTFRLIQKTRDRMDGHGPLQVPLHQEPIPHHAVDDPDHLPPTGPKNRVIALEVLFDGSRIDR